MADRIIVFWRDIPAQVIIRKRRETAKRELTLRFTEAIDMCAMRVGARDSDAYLAEWRKADPIAVSDDLEAEADKAASEIEANYTKERLVALVKNEGFEKDTAQ
ncbi:virulence factor [Oricola sp.]|uniref:virulence factor n=1 Tax=Oricola sp. TaxID=1979950 RepID=UPI000C8E8785|nr:hypothetical protein [Ahrensia sp.]|tara:strand:+ start:2777 stop:3088 length:312 start_codon:yes stop_codon:yes gene_type:complete